MEPDWKGLFVARVKYRNTTQVDAFQGIFEAHALCQQESQRLRAAAMGMGGSWGIGSSSFDLAASVRSPGPENMTVQTLQVRVASLQSDLAASQRKKLMYSDSIISLRDKVTNLKDALRSSQSLHAVTSSCLREREVELRDKETEIDVAKQSLESISNAHTKLKDELRLCKCALREKSCETERLLDQLLWLKEQEVNRQNSLVERGAVQPQSRPAPSSAVSQPLSPHVDNAASVPQQPPQPPSHSGGVAAPDSYDDARLHSTPTDVHCPKSSTAAVGANKQSTFGIAESARVHKGLVQVLSVGSPGLNSAFPDGVIISGGVDGCVAFIQPDTCEVTFATTVAGAHRSPVVSLTQSSVTALVAAACADTVVCLINAASRYPLQGRLAGHTARVTGTEFIGSGLVTGSLDRSLRMWDADKHVTVRVSISPSAVTCTANHTESSRLVSGHHNGMVAVWDSRVSGADWQPAFVSYDHHSDMLTGLSLGQDGVTLATQSKDGTVRLSDLRRFGASHSQSRSSPIAGTAADRKVIFKTTLPFAKPSLSRDMQHILTATTTSVAVWDVCHFGLGDGKIIDSPLPLTVAEWSVNGNGLVSGHRDGTVALWKAVDS